MKTKIAFTEETKKRVLKFFKENSKHEIVNEQACIDEAFDSATRGEGDSHYELSSFESKTGNPIIIVFKDSDFEWEETEE